MCAKLRINQDVLVGNRIRYVMEYKRYVTELGHFILRKRKKDGVRRKE